MGPPGRVAGRHKGRVGVKGVKRGAAEAKRRSRGGGREARGIRTLPSWKLSPDSPAVCRFSCAFRPHQDSQGLGSGSDTATCSPLGRAGEGAGCKQLVLILEAAQEMPVTSAAWA